MHILLEHLDKNWVLNIPPADIPSSKRYQHMKLHPPRAQIKAQTRCSSSS